MKRFLMCIFLVVMSVSAYAADLVIPYVQNLHPGMEMKRACTLMEKRGAVKIQYGVYVMDLDTHRQIVCLDETKGIVDLVSVFLEPYDKSNLDEYMYRNLVVMQHENGDCEEYYIGGRHRYVWISPQDSTILDTYVGEEKGGYIYVGYRTVGQ